jgi:hypothetical protein
MAPVKRLLLSWLMPVFLLLAQQGVLLHELGHNTARHTGVSAQRGDHPAPQEAPCEACVGFAHLAFAASLEVPALALLGHLSHQLQQHTGASQAWPLALPPRSRGPPLIG